MRSRMDKLSMLSFAIRAGGRPAPQTPLAPRAKDGRARKEFPWFREYTHPRSADRAVRRVRAVRDARARYTPCPHTRFREYTHPRSAVRAVRRVRAVRDVRARWWWYAGG